MAESASEQLRVPVALEGLVSNRPTRLVLVSPSLTEADPLLLITLLCSACLSGFPISASPTSTPNPRSSAESSSSRRVSRTTTE